MISAPIRTHSWPGLLGVVFLAAVALPVIQAQKVVPSVEANNGHVAITATDVELRFISENGMGTSAPISLTTLVDEVVTLRQELVAEQGKRANLSMALEEQKSLVAQVSASLAALQQSLTQGCAKDQALQALTDTSLTCVSLEPDLTQVGATYINPACHPLCFFAEGRMEMQELVRG